MKKKFLATVCAFAMTALVLTGCGSGNDTGTKVTESVTGTEAATNAAETTPTDTADNGENTQTPTEGAAKDSVIVAMGINSEPTAGFDPAFGWGAGEHVHEPLIQSTLTVTTPDLKIDFDLATEMEASEDGMIWIVKIRDDVKFTDGERLTAEDVAFTYNSVRKGNSVNDFTMLKKAEAVDETTIKFYMTKPYSIWPYTMAIVGIVPEHAYGPDYGSKPIGSGRYIMKQWDKGQQIIFEANPDYYGQEIKMKKVTILFMDEDAAFAAAKAGQVDLSYTAASFSDQQIDGYELLNFETVDNRGINLPATPAQDGSGNDFTSDLNVRRAINIGIDRQAMIDHILNGYGTPAYSVCDKMPWYNKESEVAYDLEGAKKLLDEAGFVPGADGIREKDGLRASMTILYPTGDSVRQALAAETGNQLKLLGIEVKTEGVGWDTAYKRALSEPLMWGWGAHTPMELYNIYHTLEGTAGFSPYANATVDKYMDAALKSSDLEVSYDLWQKAQWDGTTGVTQQGDIPWVWFVNIDHLYFSRVELTIAEQKIHPHGHGWTIVNNVDQWEWK